VIPGPNGLVIFSAFVPDYLATSASISQHLLLVYDLNIASYTTVN